MRMRMVSPLALAVALSCGGAAWAAGNDDTAAGSTAIDQQTAASPGSTAAGSSSSTMLNSQNTLTTERLMEMNVQGSAGENVGEIEELVIDRSSGEIQGVVVSVGGFLGIGDKKVALPWNQLQFGANDTLTTSATKQQLEQAQAWQDPDQQTATGAGSSSGTGMGSGGMGSSGTATTPTTPPASTTR